MKKRVLNITASIIVMGLFIWLAIRNVNLTELWEQISAVTFYWIPPFLIAMFFSHFLRAERWRLLLINEKKEIRRTTLFAGVMIGYVFNSIIPRLGEVTRPVYVARQHDMSSSNLIGTIVIERLIDLATMCVLIFLAAFFLLEDLGALQELFGIEQWPWYAYTVIPVLFLVIVLSVWLVYKLLMRIEDNSKISSPLVLKIVEKVRAFSEGILSIRRVKNWPMFLLLTGGIWMGYILMTYLPFYMMSLQSAYGLTLSDATVLTMVSSIGVSIPTPAGIGSYHLLIQQSMWLFYKIPLVTALTYATVAHGITVMAVFIIGPIALWWDKYYTLKHGGVR